MKSEYCHDFNDADRHCAICCSTYPCTHKYIHKNKKKILSPGSSNKLYHIYMYWKAFSKVNDAFVKYLNIRIFFKLNPNNF